MEVEIILTIGDGETYWKVGIRGWCDIDRKNCTVTIPCPFEPGEKVVLDDVEIIAFAEHGLHGLRLIDTGPYVPGDASQDGEPHPDHMDVVRTGGVGGRAGSPADDATT